MNEFGMSPFPGGYGRSPHPSTDPPRSGGESGTSRQFLMFLLLIACVALGAIFNWAIHEREHRTDLSVRNEKLQNAYVVVLANRGDVARFLTDPRTRLYHLEPRGGASGGVTVAWQQERGRGLLIGDQMPALSGRENYVIWSLGAARPAIECGAFRSDPADTFYQFQPGDAASVSGFLVSVETDRDATKPGQIMYATN